MPGRARVPTWESPLFLSVCTDARCIAHGVIPPAPGTPNMCLIRSTGSNLRTLAEEAIQSGAEIVVITGGEPAIHPLYELVHELRIRSMPIHLETCGAFPVQGEMDWITLSPKWNKMPIEETFLLADEFKVIVETPEDLTKWTEALPMKERRVPVWLHPEWSKAENPQVLGAINQWIKDHGFPYRAGYQLHKLYKVDEADERSRPTASLSQLKRSDKLEE